MAFSIQDYLKNNKIQMGKITKEVGDTPFKGGHNDIRKTNYDVKITEDGKLDLYTHKKVVISESKKLINEASDVQFNELKPQQQKQVQSFEKILNGKHIQLWDGIHGYIATIKVQNGAERVYSEDLKKLLSLKIRWIEISGQEITLGFYL